jgi:hypothetical protein
VHEPVPGRYVYGLVSGGALAPSCGRGSFAAPYDIDQFVPTAGEVDYQLVPAATGGAAAPIETTDAGQTAVATSVSATPTEADVSECNVFAFE